MLPARNDRLHGEPGRHGSRERPGAERAMPDSGGREKNTPFPMGERQTSMREGAAQAAHKRKPELGKNSMTGKKIKNNYLFQYNKKYHFYNLQPF